tara:strand:+ start:2549 stop:4321 length:1773 start_codon:yes stop_codon:yes gene_type:complete
MFQKIVLTKTDNFFKKNHKNTYLSRACFSYDLEKKLPNEIKKLSPHHWNDYDKLKKDKEYFNELIDRIFPALLFALNSLKKKKYSKKFWKILITHWLHSFIYINFDHWEMIRNLKLKEKKYFIDTFQINNEDIIPNTLEDYIRLFGSDAWRQIMLIKILKFKFLKSKKKIEYLINNNLENDISKNRHIIEKYQKNLIKKFIINSYNKIFGFIIKKQNFLIARSYLGRLNEILLNLKLFQLPTIFVPNIYTLSSKPSLEFRGKITLNFIPTNNFEKFLKKEIINQLPISFLEGFDEIENKIKDLNFPETPKCIFVSNSHHKSVLSRYCANNAENGCKIIHGQYGGSYGQWDMHWLEKYYKSISDIYLTWGWTDHPNTYPLGMLRPLGPVRKEKKNYKQLLMIGKTIKSYGYSLDSNSRACQSKNYLNDCFLAIKNLRIDIKENLKIRLKPVGKGWEEKDRFKDLLSANKIDMGKESIFSVIKKTKIYFATYNGTGYLESLAMNIPTVLFSNPYDEKLRGDSLEYFKLLEDNKIYFKDPILATNHINQVWDDVNKWWLSEKVQSAREKFCLKYAKNNTKKLDDIIKIFKKEL